MPKRGQRHAGEHIRGYLGPVDRQQPPHRGQRPQPSSLAPPTRARQRLTTARFPAVSDSFIIPPPGPVSCGHSSLRILPAARLHDGGTLDADTVEGAAGTPPQRLPRAASPRRTRRSSGRTTRCDPQPEGRGRFVPRSVDGRRAPRVCWRSSDGWVGSAAGSIGWQLVWTRPAIRPCARLSIGATRCSTTRNVRPAALSCAEGRPTSRTSPRGRRVQGCR